MRRRSGAGGESIKGRQKAVTPKRRDAQKPVSTSRPIRKAEVARLTRELKDARERQAATSEVLRVISRSKFELQPVLQSVMDTAARLCRAEAAIIFRLENGFYRFAAGYSLDPSYLEIEQQTLISPGQGTLIGRAALSRRVVRIDDAWTDPFYEKKHDAKIAAVRSMIGVPLMREGEPIGVIGLGRSRVEPFADREIELVATFADQAVIAIENVRLFEAEQQRSRELAESLEQQTASAEVLQVISRSPDDLQPVFAAMLENAARICDAHFGNIFRWDGEALWLVATHNTPPAFADRRRVPFRPSQGNPIGDMLNANAVVHVADLAADERYVTRRDREVVAAVELGGIRTFVAVPLVKDKGLIGAVIVYRQEVRPFSEKQIELLQNFAAQAVIAIENARLLNELRQRTTDLTEALEQQTATADVLRVISSSPGDLTPVFSAMLANGTRLCQAAFGGLFLRDGDVMQIGATHLPTGAAPMYPQGTLVPLCAEPELPLARMTESRQILHIADLHNDPSYLSGNSRIVPLVESVGARTMLCVPMLKENEVIGGFVFLRHNEVRPFDDKQVALVTSFANQAVIAIENARLLNELRQRTGDLTEALEQQTATSEVLRVISSSPGDLQPVFDALLENATRLCEASYGAMWLSDGEGLRKVAMYGALPEAYVAQTRAETVAFDANNTMARAVRSRTPVQVDDLRKSPVYIAGEPLPVAAVEIAGIRTLVAVPMFKENEPVGAIVIYRTEVRPFTDKQIELVKNFAAQAVIAIENARLLNELRQRTDDLTRSLEDLRMTQDRLVQTQKLALLGQLTAGIAHEIKNPLNFVNNFSGVSVELIDELQEALQRVQADDKTRSEIGELADTLRDNLGKIVQHGRRADAIVKNMLLHSREGSGEHRPVDINAIVDEALNLAYHGARAEKQDFTVTLQRSFDPEAGQADVFPQDITRVLLNLISNGFYAATRRKGTIGSEGFQPTVAAVTRSLGDRVEIGIRDNGTGIPPEVKEKMFNPFFTTKPAGEGTGLGLSISYDIVVKQHAGSIEVDTQPANSLRSELFHLVPPHTFQGNGPNVYF